jgi:putative flippase GtrA
MKFNKIFTVQFFRFILIGIFSNLLLFGFYLFLTGFGVGYKTAMTLLYGIGIAQTFFLQKRLTFNHQGFFRSSFFKYLTAYGLGYLINFSALLFFVDYLAFPHELVQGLMILIIAVLMFLLLKLWVFRSATT